MCGNWLLRMKINKMTTTANWQIKYLVLPQKILFIFLCDYWVITIKITTLCFQKNTIAINLLWLLVVFFFCGFVLFLAVPCKKNGNWKYIFASDKCFIFIFRTRKYSKNQVFFGKHFFIKKNKNLNCIIWK